MRSSHWCQFVILVSIFISSSLATSTQTAQFVRLFRNLLSRRNSDLNEDSAIIARFLTRLDQLGGEEEAVEGRNIASDPLSERMEPVREEEKNKHDHEQNSVHKHWSTNEHSHEHQEESQAKEEYVETHNHDHTHVGEAGPRTDNSSTLYRPTTTITIT